MPSKASGGLVVTPVRGGADERAFRSLPYRLYRGDPNWVAPLRSQERRRWSPRRNPSLRTRWVRRFLARRGRRVVGRVAAIEDRAFAERWRPGAGLFGFFECAPDAAAAALLLEAAEEALRERGLDTVLGPVNLTTNDEVGLLVAGFDRRPTMLTPYNPERYVEMLEGRGYRGCGDYHAYRWTWSSPRSPAIARLEEAAARGSGFFARTVVRPLEPRAWDRELEILFGLYNQAFAQLWGFVPLSRAEFWERAAAFRPFYRPDLALVAERDGRPAGFALVLPDVNEALAPLRGRLLPLGWLRLLRGLRRIRGARFVLLGVLPGMTGRGIAPVLATSMERGAQRAGLEEVEVSLVHGANRKMQRVIEGMGCTRSKTYRLYEKAL